MEKQAEAMLAAQVSRFVSYPGLKQKFEEHLAEAPRRSHIDAFCSAPEQLPGRV